MAGISLATIYIYLLFFGSFLPSIVILFSLKWLKLRPQRRLKFLIGSISIWVIFDLIGFGLLADTTMDGISLSMLIKLAVIFLAFKSAVFSLILFAHSDVPASIRAFFVFFLVQTLFFSLAANYYTYQDRKGGVQHEIYYSNMIDFQGSLFVAREGGDFYRLTKDKVWTSLAKLPENIKNPQLVATQNNIFLLGFQEQRAFSKPHDKKFIKAFRWKENSFQLLSIPLSEDGSHSTRAYSVVGAPDLFFIEGLGLFVQGETWFRARDYREYKNRFHITGSPAFYHSKWYAFDRDSIVELEWNPSSVFKGNVSIISATPVTTIEPDKRNFTPQFFLIADDLYAVNGSVLFQWKQSDFEKISDMKIPESHARQSIRDVVGEKGKIFFNLMSHGDGSYEIVKIEPGKKPELLPLPIDQGGSTEISSLLYKDQTLYVSFKHVGIFTYKSDHWKKMNFDEVLQNR